MRDVQHQISRLRWMTGLGSFQQRAPHAQAIVPTLRRARCSIEDTSCGPFPFLCRDGGHRPANWRPFPLSSPNHQAPPQPSHRGHAKQGASSLLKRRQPGEVPA